MKHLSFARLGALGIVATLSAACLAQSALLSFPTSTGASVGYYWLPECKLSSGIPTMSYSSTGLFKYKTYQPGQPVYGNITIKVPPGPSPLDDLVNAMLGSAAGPTTFQITMLDDPITKACSRYNYLDCFITAFKTPPCNREASTPSVSEIVVTKQQDSALVDLFKWPKPAQITKQKAWLCSNFRVTIDGLEAACSNARHIEPISVVKTDEDSDGDGFDDYTVSDFVMDIPNDSAMGKGMYDWMSSRDARPCTIQYLAADGSVTRTFTLTSMIPVQLTRRSTSTLTLRCAVSGPMSWTS